MKQVYYKVIKRDREDDDIEGPVFLLKDWADQYVDKFLGKDKYEVVETEEDCVG